jgi:hypothetical protein
VVSLFFFPWDEANWWSRNWIKIRDEQVPDDGVNGYGHRDG